MPEMSKILKIRKLRVDIQCQCGSIFSAGTNGTVCPGCGKDHNIAVSLLNTEAR